MLIMMFSNEPKKLEPYHTMGCDIVLLQSGVFLFDMLPEGFKNVYVLEQHFNASGLAAKTTSTRNDTYNIQMISETEWVELCATLQPIVSIQ